MQAETKRKASREKCVRVRRPDARRLVDNGEKKRSAWVEMTAVCLIGRIAST
jgi:hypothetical protein